MSREVRKEEINTCLTYCVARYFNMDPLKVPFFIEHGSRYGHYLRRFFRRRGLYIECLPFSPKFLQNKRKLYIVQGQSVASKAKSIHSKRALHHVVLYRGKKPYYDPGRRQRFLKCPLFYWHVSKRPIDWIESRNGRIVYL